MNCKNCLHRKICRHYNYFVTNYLDIIELDCDNYEEKPKKLEAFNLGPASLGVTQPRPQRFNPLEAELNSYAKLYPEVFEDVEKTTIKAEPVTIQKVECDRCKQMVPSTEIDNCNTCGRPVCQNCQVKTLEDGNVVTYCESCWSNTPDPELDENGKPVVIYAEEQEDPWDIDALESEGKPKKEETQEEVKEVKDNGTKEKKSRGTVKSTKKQ